MAEILGEPVAPAVGNTNEPVAQASGTKVDEGDGKDRPVDNLKAEMDRKFTKYETVLNDSVAQIKQMNQQNQDLLVKLQEQQASPSPAPTDIAQAGDTADWYDTTPEQYKAQIRKDLLPELKKEVLTDVQSTQQEQIRISAILQDAGMKYPDLTNPDTELRKTVDQFYDALPADLKTKAEGYELALARGINKVGATPKRAYKSQGEDFSLSSNQQRPAGAGATSDFTDDDYRVAKGMGQDLNDEKYAAKVKKRKKEINARLDGGR